MQTRTTRSFPRYAVPLFAALVTVLAGSTVVSTPSWTAASGQNRSTPIASLTRENGLIVIQGFEDGRAFSFAIDEATGDLNAAIATASGANVVFAACTPVPASR